MASLLLPAAGSPPPTDGSVVAAMQTVLVNTTGTQVWIEYFYVAAGVDRDFLCCYMQASPVIGVGFFGLGFRDTAPNYLGPHGTPSGGDWAVGRSGALFFEGTVGATIDVRERERDMRGESGDAIERGRRRELMCIHTFPSLSLYL
jgi:hypothetical protein